MHVQTCSITASKCITKLARLRPPSASQNSLNHRLQVYLQSCCITASMSIPNPAPLWHPCSHNHGLQVHLHIHSIVASKCISIVTRSRSPSASPNLLNQGQGLYSCVHSIDILRHTSKLGKIECVFGHSLIPSPLFLYLRMYIYRETWIIHAIL